MGKAMINTVFSNFPMSELRGLSPPNLEKTWKSSIVPFVGTTLLA